MLGLNNRVVEAEVETWESFSGCCYIDCTAEEEEVVVLEELQYCNCTEKEEEELLLLLW
jgi:hypothetical protein